MSGHDDFPASETAEHVVTTPPPVSNTCDMLPPHSGARRNRSNAWDHFTIEPGTEKKAKCKYCGCFIRYDNGTSGMRSHLMRCKHHPEKDVNKRQKSISSSTVNEGHVSSSPSFAKFDQEAIRHAMVEYFVDCEIPFRRVEKASFHKFMGLASPRFIIPSRTTVARDILKIWDIEKAKLKKFLSQQYPRRVCLTTDTWTSSQNLYYMCLTVHFIDNNWMLNKKILNFCQVTSHTGENLFREVDRCLTDWGINRVLGLTVDNASSNDVMIVQLKKRFLSKNCLVLNGNYLHMRCCAHILNLIVKEGFKELDDSIFRIRAAVKFVKSSPSRFKTFKKCIGPDMDYGGFVGLDTETRWNSTYLMLDAALKHRKTFEELELEDPKYTEELEKGKGVPLTDDWEYVRSILPFLKIFYEVTLKVSGSSYVTSSSYMYEVFGIGSEIRAMCNSSDARIKSMAESMKKKYDKYWGDLKSLNMLLVIALVLDPRHKMKFLSWYMSMTNNFEMGVRIDFKRRVESCLYSLFNEYNNGGVEGFTASSQGSQPLEGSENNRYGFGQFYQTSGCNDSESELSVYLEEKLEKPVEMDILNWWKINSSRFPILANIAREVLAIPVSTVASESAFSTGGRVLDPYRSCLTPTTVEALICTQDWLGSSAPVLTNEDLNALEQFEQELNSSQNVACSSTSVALDDI